MTRALLEQLGAQLQLSVLVTDQSPRHGPIARPHWCVKVAHKNARSIRFQTIVVILLAPGGILTRTVHQSYAAACVQLDAVQRT
jgi:hypothetical protein